MATRDRTQDYMVIRSQQRTKNAELVSLTQDPSSAAVQVENPLWVRILQNVRSLEVDATTELRAMEELIAIRTHVGGSNRDLDAEERAIEQKHQKIVKIFQQASAQVKRLDIKNLDDALKQTLTDGGTQTELSLLRNASMCLAQELDALNTELKNTKSRFLHALERQKNARDRFAGGDKQKEFEKRMARDRQLEEYRSQGLSQAQRDTIELNTRLADEQNADFRRILEGIKALNEMFQDLHTMIIEQGTLLDRIDHNMTEAHQKVVKGRQEVEKAQKHLEASSFTLCILLMVVMVIGLLLALMLKMATN